MSPASEKTKVVKLVTVGDSECGKTSLLTTYDSGQFPTDYVPTVFDAQVKQVQVDRTKVTLYLWDTAGQEEYQSMRRLCYPDTSVFLVCFNIAEPDTLQNAREHWEQEVRQACPGTPLVLVGTKQDLREDPEVLAKLKARNLKPVTTAEGETAAKDIGAFAYHECSALKQTCVDEVFETAVTAALKKRRTRCTLL